MLPLPAAGRYLPVLYFVAPVLTAPPTFPQITTQAPTVRVLSAKPDRHIISCPADVAIWRPIAEYHPIFTQELLLTAALKQEVDWDSNEFRVDGSY